MNPVGIRVCGSGEAEERELPWVFLSVIPGFHCQASPGASRKAPRVGGGEEEVEGEIFVE